MRRILRGALIISLAIGSVSGLQAQEESESLYDLSLEELLDYAVISATKTEVSVRKAPSVVRVFTQKDFEEYGFTSLQQVMENIPGVQVQQYRAGHQLAWVRGVQARYNNKVLLLIDGVPMRDGFYGNITFDEMLPLEMVEKVEVLNGPGSVLYGANSFAGVINITTKSKGSRAGLRYGTFNTKKAYLNGAHSGFFAHASYLDSDGFQPELMVDGLDRSIDQSNQSINAFAKYEANNLKVLGGFTRHTTPYTYRSTDKNYAFERSPLYGSVQYRFELGEQATLNTSAFINRYNFTRLKTKYTDEQVDEIKEIAEESMHTVMEGLETSYFNQLGNHQLTAGLSWFRDRSLDMTERVSYHINGAEKEGDFALLVDDQIKRSNLGLYFQDVLNLNENLALTAGVRYEALSDFDNQFNYRLALTGQQGKFYGKALYGTAYRVPSYREYLTVDAPNADLQPEHLATLEAQLGYKYAIGDLNLTFYHNQYTNFIGEVNVATIEQDGQLVEIDDEMAFNFNSRKITGLELNNLLMVSNKLVVNWGAGYVLSATETMGELPDYVNPEEAIKTDQQPLYFLSKFNTNLLATYKLGGKFKVGANLLYGAARNTPDNYQTGVPDAVVNPDNAGQYLRLDLHAGFNPHPKIRIKGWVRNLLDSKLYSPPYGGASGYDAEWPGRTLSLEVNYRF